MRTNKAYIIMEKIGIKNYVKSIKKVVAVWLYQLLIGHVIIAPDLNNKLQNRDSEEY
jgi:hypothetical protein